MMIINLETFLPIMLYLCLIVLVIVFVILGIKLIRVLDKVDETLDDVNKKIQSVDGVFSIIDKTTGIANTLSDKIIDGIVCFVSRLFKNKKGNDEDE